MVDNLSIAVDAFARREYLKQRNCVPIILIR